jgi:hypothetical protein
MIGRYLEYSGGGRALADWLLLKLGKDRASWAMMIAAFLVGLPIFFEVGFIILVPLVWNLAKETKRSLLFYGLPMAAALTVYPLVGAAASRASRSLSIARRRSGANHSVWHPGLDSDGDRRRNGLRPMDRQAPAHSGPRDRFHRNGKGQRRAAARDPDGDPAARAAGSSDLGATIVTMSSVPAGSPLRAAGVFLGHPFAALTITVIASLIFFGTRRGLTRTQAGKMAGEALAPMGALLCIMGGGGALKQIIVDSGAGAYLGKVLITSAISPLLVVYIVAALMRAAQGSATVAIITAAGIVAPIVKGIPGYSADLIVLALCCGGTAFFPRQRRRLLDGQPVLRHVGPADAKVLDRHEDRFLTRRHCDCNAATGISEIARATLLR